MRFRLWISFLSHLLTDDVGNDDAQLHSALGIILLVRITHLHAYPLSS